MTQDKLKQIDEEFLTAWGKSYGRAIYGEIGFQTTDLGSKFEVDKYLVLNFLHSKLEEAVKEERERIKEMIDNESLEFLNNHRIKRINDLKSELTNEKLRTQKLTNLVKDLQFEILRLKAQPKIEIKCQS